MEPSETKELEGVVVRLQRKFPAASGEIIRREVARVRHDFDQARVRTYIPILVEREVADQLRRHPAAFHGSAALYAAARP